MEVSQSTKPTLQSALDLIAALQAALEAATARIAKLEESKRSDSSDREMTDEDAVKVLTGELKDAKHKDAAKALGLSYGQIYSCRLEYTFKHVHRAMREAGTKNVWAK